VLVQTRAHGAAVPARAYGHSVRFDEPQPRVAPGQAVVVYDGDVVLGGGVAR
jgi:tRNA-specific 2-thiouridylase